jgi:hypothetical protein
LPLTLTEPRGRVVDHLRGPPDQAAAPSGRPDRGGDVDQRAADAWLTRALAAASGWAVPVRPAIWGGPCRSSSGTHARPGRRSRPDPVRSSQIRRCRRSATARSLLIRRGVRRDEEGRPGARTVRCCPTHARRLPVQSFEGVSRDHPDDLGASVGAHVVVPPPVARPVATRARRWTLQDRAGGDRCWC